MSDDWLSDNDMPLDAVKVWPYVRPIMSDDWLSDNDMPLDAVKVWPYV